jgi:hypothetical protein
LKRKRSIQGGKKFGLFISVTRHLLTQGALKKFVQSHFDRTEIVTRISFQETIMGQSVNFRFAYLDRQAAQPVSPPFAVPAHALNCGRASCERGIRWVRRHFTQPQVSQSPQFIAFTFWI